VGIQKLAASLDEYFPGVPVVRLDRDTTRKEGELAARVAAFARGEYQIMLGTQMLAKGLNFPGVDLVGVIFADLSLNFPEFTAAERTFQLLTQVAGRAGRGERRGEVLIQTLMPRHYSVRFAARHDYAGFYAHELGVRRELGFPPFSRLVLLRGQAVDEGELRDFLQRLAADLREKIKTRGWQRELEVLGPVPGAILRVKNRYRWYLLLRGRHRPRLHRLVSELRSGLRPPRRLSLFIDVDPLSFV
jgi:primosomal protein N' (replication factor Y)